MADFTRLNQTIRSVTLSLEDVNTLYVRLSQLVIHVGNQHSSDWIKTEEETDDAFSKRKSERLSSAYRITVTIRGANGEHLFGDSAEIFASPSMPHVISAIFMTNVTAFAAASNDINPYESFNLNLDFSRPPLIDGHRIPSAPTPNESAFEAAGTPLWVAGIKDAVTKTISSRTNRRRSLHASMIYDLGMMLVALPSAFYVCWKFSALVNAASEGTHPVITGALYIYIVLTCLWIYRGLFGYLKWAFPIVEMSNTSTARKHRKFWIGITALFIAPLCYDLLKRWFGQLPH